MAKGPNLTNAYVSRGRPKKSPESPKKGYLGFRLPQEELDAIEAAAAAAGESVSEYVRKAIASRMEERQQLIPPASLSYQISPVKIDDNKLASIEGTSSGTLFEVKSFVGRLHLTENESLNKESSHE